MIDREGKIENDDLENGVEDVKTDDSSTSGDDSGLQQTIQNTQSELVEVLSDGEIINTDSAEYTSDEYYESIEKQQVEAEALKDELFREELNDEHDSVIETGQDYNDDSDGYDKDDDY